MRNHLTLSTISTWTLTKEEINPSLTISRYFCASSQVDDIYVTVSGLFYT